MTAKAYCSATGFGGIEVIPNGDGWSCAKCGAAATFVLERPQPKSERYFDLTSGTWSTSLTAGGR